MERDIETEFFDYYGIELQELSNEIAQWLHDVSEMYDATQGIDVYFSLCESLTFKEPEPEPEEFEEQHEAEIYANEETY
jgi:hypothetical protein